MWKDFWSYYTIDLSISSPYALFGIDPGIYCIVGLNGSESAGLGTHINTTLSSGSVYYSLSFTIIMLFSQYLQHLLHLSLISLSHQFRQDPWLPCSGQNGPIIGYSLYYTNIMFSVIVNITGEDNRQYNLTTLRPYTNYTVTVTAYNDGGTGSTSNKITQETEEAGKSIIIFIS